MATEIFVSYSHRDDKYLLDDSLLGHLKGLQRDGASFWDDRKIQAGLLWEDVIKQKLDAADIVLALVSEMFLASEYCQNTEIANSLKRSRESGLIIFPVIISACSWNQFDWLLQRQFLPRDGRNIEQHFGGPGKRKAIFQQILEALREHVKAVERTKHHKGDDLRSLAIKAISDSINIINRLDPQITSFHHNIPENNGGYHHIDYKGEVERIVDGNSKETLLTADDLKKIRSERQLRHINIFHEALERSYAAWEALYLNRPVDGSNEHKLQYDKQMRQTIAEMKDALDRVLSFLQAANLEVEDHYYLFKNIVEEESRKLNDD